MSDNSILWPNGIKVDSDGYAVFYQLGTNKVEVPSEDEWPEGVKLKSPFVYDENGELVGFVDTKAMIVNGPTTITLPYKEIKAKFTSIAKGDLIVNAPNATVTEFTWAVGSGEGGEGGVEINFKYKGCKTFDDVIERDANYKTNDIVDGVWSESLADLETGSYSDQEHCLFANCENLVVFRGDLSSLTNGWSLFNYCENLASFESDLPSLESGHEMFRYCNSLTSFTSDLSSLTNGMYMFADCYDLISFTSDLSSLTNGMYMFYLCTNLTTFTSDLSSLIDGSGMFYCTNLTTFNAKLSSLTDGNGMFDWCNLDSASVKNIIDTINTVSSGSLNLGMGCDYTTTDKNLFAQEIGYNTMTELLAALQAKGWTVTAQYNGRPTTTYSLRQPAIEEGERLPVFVKLEEVEGHASHISLDETKKYRMTWFHETTGSTNGYTQYATLEEAIEALNIKPIERH